MGIFTLKLWTKAIIKNKRERHICVEYIGSEDPEQWLKTKEQTITEEGTHAIDFEWRFQLKVGDVIDACDECCNWYKSTVLKVETAKPYDLYGEEPQ